MELDIQSRVEHTSQYGIIELQYGIYISYTNATKIGVVIVYATLNMYGVQTILQRHTFCTIFEIAMICARETDSNCRKVKCLQTSS